METSYKNGVGPVAKPGRAFIKAMGGFAIPNTPRINDAAFVAREYSDDARLTARAAFWKACTGPQPQDVALQRICQLAPTTVLEVGCGQGAFAATLLDAGIGVIAVDQSERMVALTAARGVAVQRADVQELPFRDGVFDVVTANYMLYHVPDIPRALREIVRVLRPGGALVAATNSERKLQEMWDLAGRDPAHSGTFTREKGLELLAPYFATVERVDIDQEFTVTEAAIRDYIRATRFSELADNIPALRDGLLVRSAGSVFVATA